MREKQKTLVIEFEDWNDSFIDYFETLFVLTQQQQSGNNWVLHTGLYKLKIFLGGDHL